MTKDTTTTTTTTTTGPPSPSTSTNYFLACFGFSGEKTDRLTDEVNSGSRQRRRRRRWSFGFKKSPTKTVPVDLATVPSLPRKPKSNTSWEIMEENATPAKKHAILVDRSHVPAISGEQKPRRRKLKPAATSPEQKTVTITHSFISSPLKHLTQQQKPPHTLPGGRVIHKTTPSGRELTEFDSIIGMSIILVILGILVLCGKLCAILCTSAWFFIARRLVAAGERSAVGTGGKPPPERRNKMDLESEEYKKKVVLEGFLQRDHRRVGVGRL